MSNPRNPSDEFLNMVLGTYALPTFKPRAMTREEEDDARSRAYPMREARLEAERDSWRSAYELTHKEVVTLRTGGNISGVAVEVEGGRIAVATEQGLMEMPLPGLRPAGARRDIRPGDTILMNTDGAVVGFLGLPPGGEVGVVREVHRLSAVVEASGGRILLRVPSAMHPAVGDRVSFIGAARYVTAVLPRPPAERAHEAPTRVDWDDIGGCEEAKAALREALEQPALHPGLFAAYGRRQCRGVMLYGPPGGGKTLLARAAATSIARAHGQSHAVGFQYVKGPELLSRWVGAAEEAIRNIFTAAREHKARHGYPALVFIDEADALLGRRDAGAHGRSASGIEATTVPQFLAEMDGLEDSGAIVLLATNRPDALDAAVTRDGRIDRRVYVGRPGPAETRAIARIHLRGRPVAAGADLAEAVVRAVGSTEVSWAGGSFTMPLVLSGAVIAGIVERAAGHALARDIEAGAAAPGGITPEDILRAAADHAQSIRHLDHSEAIADAMASAEWTRLPTSCQNADSTTPAN